MKSSLKQPILFSILLLILFGFIYPLIISAIGMLTPGKGGGVKLQKDGKVIGYANIGQKFVSDRYFQGRPSAVDYNAAGSGGSNKGPTNQEYLKVVQARIDTFLVHNPAIMKSSIPADLVTASGSGLDPHISVQGAKIQVERISKVRKMESSKVNALVHKHTERPLLGLFGPERVNVLQLNLELDQNSR